VTSHLPEAATGIVLAGGRSSRFGRDKLAEPYRGAPLLHHAVLRLSEVCATLVVVLAPEVAEPTLPLGIEATFARDADEGEGPLAGVYAGLLACGTSIALVAAGDMPNLRTSVLLELVRVAREATVDAVALAEDDRARPLPCALRVARASELAHALLHDGRRRLGDLLDASRTAVIDEPTWVALDPERRTLHDVDVPGDLAR
jgi:molybdopterin-guanine dinucleotide biosynthesis protein A